MKIKTDFPQDITEIENTWIPMPDGTRLAARIWMPKNADKTPVPAILEYIPYRKSDLSAFSDSSRHRYFAGHGYACVRVDIRGSGDSEGILLDEYHPQEQEDAVNIIAWLAEQTWCSGRVGMTGISWGGFNALQVAAHRPSALKAIITVCSTDDRYADDVHYIGGCLLSQDALPWATTLMGFNALPPNSKYSGDTWNKIWLNSLENSTHFIEPWLSNQRRNEYWQQGSVCQDFSAIQCPVYAIGGWADGYTNAIFRLLEGLRGPRKGLIGPWSHNWPHESRPGPTIGFLQECLRWWDFWLKDIETGIMQEPMLRAWIQESVKPASQYIERPGRWVAEPSWPPTEKQDSDKKYYLNPDGLQTQVGISEDKKIVPNLNHGQDSGVWCPFGAKGDLPTDQQSEDERSLCFDAAPATEPTEILGHPVVDLAISADQPVAQLVVRLCDVADDGSSLMVSRGVLNLTHLKGHQDLQPLVPGEWYKISLKLDAIAHTLPRGHYWRIAVGTSYWPMVWSAPEQVTMQMKTGEDSHLTLPVRYPKAEDEVLSEFQAAECATPIQLDFLKKPSSNRSVSKEPHSNRVTIEKKSAYGRMRFENGHEIEGTSRDAYEITGGEINTASVRCHRRLGTNQGEKGISVEIESGMESDQQNFNVKSQLKAFEGEKEIFNRDWKIGIPRDLV